MRSFRVTVTALCCAMVVLGVLPLSLDAQLDPSFYRKTCPNVHSIVLQVVSSVAQKDPRMLASLVRLHFHDCFVQGCDASILLNNTATIVSEQQALPNNNSIRGLDVVNQIKTAVENICPGVVSCADILTLAAEISSVLAGGPCWKVPLGRRDSLTANRTLANQNLPAPFFNLTQLKAAFKVQGLNTTDLVALSDTISIVNKFSSDQKAFFDSFVASMIKMGNIGVLTGTKGEIRKQCNFVNKKSAELDIAGVASKESSAEGGQSIIQKGAMGFQDLEEDRNPETKKLHDMLVISQPPQWDGIGWK
ncbi:Peroxidase 15 [Spatholobus suberectus]|nr:Peroxidase 15 [Spatholobus suberectus]